MQRHLYFICPTDHLEPVINSTFKGENCYLTSLGNTMAFDEATVGQIQALLETKNITEISFILSDDNHFVIDALGKKKLSGITELNGFYDQIVKQKKYAEELWQIYDRQFLILSYYLNNKIKELKLGLQHLPIEPLLIKGKIYNREKKIFREIYADLICQDSTSVN